MNLRKKNIIASILCIMITSLLSCKSIKNAFLASDSKVFENIKDYKCYDIGLYPVEVIVPKNQSISQSLSIVITDNNGNLIVFDGGRIEDADYLCDIIKEKGGKVSTWFLTHIHDDHIGALYKIFEEKRIDIKIEELVYNFADFDWYYSKMGKDAGILYLFEDALKEYNKYLIENNLSDINVISDISVSDKKKYVYDSPIMVSILNDMYKLDEDPINNTSLVYLVTLNGDKRMIIFGDLGYEGGNRLFDEIDKETESEKDFVYGSEIIVLAHHGQNGIDPKLYKKFTNPKIIIWPTSEDIYMNTHSRYRTDDTKEVIDELKSVLYQVKSYEDTVVFR